MTHYRDWTDREILRVKYVDEVGRAHSSADRALTGWIPSVGELGQVRQSIGSSPPSQPSFHVGGSAVVHWTPARACRPACDCKFFICLS